MPKINHEEYEVLKGLDDRWKWIARDESEGMFLFVEKPNKYGYLPQWRNYTCDWKTFETEVFQFIQWSDEEPYNIQELIEEYEKDYKGSWEHAIEFSGEVFGESEETEVKKDLEWLKKWLYEYEDEIVSWLGDKHTGDYFSARLQGSLSAIKEIREQINQLDEPEVLSEDWIEEHHYIRMDPDNPFVYVKDLKKLLVPKQEEVDQAYKDGYEIGKKHAFEKAGLEDKDKEPETVASVIADFYKSLERLKEVLGMEIEELKEC